jgi:hypothetical protein
MLTIVWDVDDVLNDLMYQWFTFAWLEEQPNCKLSYGDLSGNPPHRALNISLNEYQESLDRFRRTNKALSMEPNRRVLAWLRDHGSDFRHIALTARPLETAPDVAHWVIRHFGSWIRCVGVVPTRATNDVPVYDRSKGEYLKWLKCGDIMVDDSSDNIKEAQALGMKTLLYPQPWNNSAVAVEALLDELSSLAVRS